MATNFKLIISSFDRNKIDSLLVTSDTNIRYLLGYPSEESWLFITPKKTFYITDARYSEEVKKNVKGVSVVCLKESKYKSLFEIVKKISVSSVGIDEHALTLFQYERLNSFRAPSVKLIKSSGIIESFRRTKNSDEVANIRIALNIQKQAVKLLKRIVKSGVTERQVYSKLENFVKSKKAGFSFKPIIASGINSVCPHASITDRKFNKNEVVLIDFGIDVNGYKSDLTRMFFLGRISKSIREINDAVRESQRVAIALIKPGVAVAEIDKQARKCLKKNKLDRYFTHALGHGVGLDIHEAPRISQKDPSILSEGMVVTVEPAVYLPGKFGIRIEDMVLVTKKGCEVLSDDIN